MRQCVEDSLVDFHSHLNDAKEQNAMILDAMACAADTHAETDRLARWRAINATMPDTTIGPTHGVDIMWDRYCSEGEWHFL